MTRAFTQTHVVVPVDDGSYWTVQNEIVEAVGEVCRRHGAALFGGALFEWAVFSPRKCANPACIELVDGDARKDYCSVRCRNRAAYYRRKHRLMRAGRWVG